MRKTVRYFALCVCTIGTLVGCTEGEAPMPVETPLHVPAAIHLSESSALVARAGTRSVQLTVARTSATSGAVVLSAEGAPAGVEVSFLPKRLEANQSLSVVTFVVAENTPPVQSTITFRATDAQSGISSAAYTLAIQPPAIALIADAGPLTARRGGPAIYPVIQVARTSAAFGVVTFTLDSAPPGVIATALPRTILDRATQTSIAMTVAGTVPLGPASVRIRASMAGVPDALLILPIIVAEEVTGGNGAFDITSSVSSVTIESDKSAVVPITVQRFGDFVGHVALEIDSASPGIGIGGVSYSPTLTAAELTIVGRVPPGEYQMRLRGRATGFPDRTLQLRVVVIPSFTLFATPLNLPAGSVGSSSINILRSTGFTGPVSLTMGSLPSYVTGALNPATTDGPFSALVLTVAPGAPAGQFSVDIIGTGVGVPDQKIKVFVNVSN